MRFFGSAACRRAPSRAVRRRESTRHASEQNSLDLPGDLTTAKSLPHMRHLAGPARRPLPGRRLARCFFAAALRHAAEQYRTPLWAVVNFLPHSLQRTRNTLAASLSALAVQRLQKVGRGPGRPRATTSRPHSLHAPSLCNSSHCAARIKLDVRAHSLHARGRRRVAIWEGGGRGAPSRQFNSMELSARRDGRDGSVQDMRPRHCTGRPRPPPRLLQAVQGQGRRGDRQGAARGLQGVRQAVLNENPHRPLLLGCVPRRRQAPRRRREPAQAHGRPQKARPKAGERKGV